MIIPAICFVGGLVAMGRTKPKTLARKLLCLGPHTGLVYPVEDFPEIGVVVVRAPGGQAVAQFLRAAVREPGARGLIYQQGQGEPNFLAAIRSDFGVPPAAIRAVPKSESDTPTMSAAAAALTPAQRELYWSTLAYRAPETLTVDQKRIVEVMKHEKPPAAPAPAPPSVKAEPKTGRSTP